MSMLFFNQLSIFKHIILIMHDFSIDIWMETTEFTYSRLYVNIRQTELN